MYGIVGRKKEMKRGSPLKMESVSERELRKTSEA